MTEIVLQKALLDRFASPLLQDRYQIIESAVFAGEYFVVDHEASSVSPILDKADSVVRFGSIQEAEEYIAPGQIQPKKGKAPGSSGKAPAAALPKPPKVVKESPAKLFHELILGGVSDEDSYSQVKEKFGETSYRPTYPAWYRKQLIKKGLLPG